MLSRLKSSVKGVVRALRGAEAPPPAAARPAPTPIRPPAAAPPVAAKPAPAPAAPVAAKPAPAPAAPVAAKPAPAPVAAPPAPVAAKAAPTEAAPKVNGTHAAAAPVNGEVAKAAPAKAEPAKAEPAKAEPAKAEPAKAAPAKAEPAKAEPAKAEPVKAEPAKAEPAKKPSLAALAAGAAKAPPPAPAAAPAADEDDHDEAPAKKPTSLAAAAAAAASGHAPARMVRADMGSTDRAAYIARAIANNRDPSSIKGNEGMNVADDGGKYWGPLDNESSRAKADGKVVTVDQFECISCGTCVEQTNRVFYLPVDGKATPIAQDGPMDLIQDAIEACPVTCIHWVDPSEAEDKGYATGVGEDWTEVINSLPVD